MVRKMNDHDQLIKLDTQVQQLQKDITDIAGHVKVMNSEQGTQAIQIAEMKTNMGTIQGQNWFIITVVVAAVIGYFINAKYKK
jgi:regulator of replication initiation timing